MASLLCRLLLRAPVVAAGAAAFLSAHLQLLLDRDPRRDGPTDSPRCCVLPSCLAPFLPPPFPSLKARLSMGIITYPPGCNPLLPPPTTYTQIALSTT